MLYVSIIVELLRTRPAAVIGFAAVAQAAIWTLIPGLFYAAPPGDLGIVIAVGHQFQLGTYLGPPFAFWLAEIVSDLTGHSLIGMFALSQACVLATYWAVFNLARAIVGAQQAALAVLLMVGISSFSIPTLEFGPAVLTMPLWAIILLHYWRAVGEHRRGYWVALAIEVGVLLLTTYAGLLLAALLVGFTLANRQARAALASSDPWVAGAVTLVVMLPHLLWLVGTGDDWLPVLSRLRAPESVSANFLAWLHQMVLILAAHAGLVLLVVLVAGLPWRANAPAPVIARPPVAAFGRHFVYYFAIVPVLAATFVAVVAGWPGPVGGVAPLVILSSLALVVAAGDGIALNRQWLVIYAWCGLLLAPPAVVGLAVLILPVAAVDLQVSHPAPAMAQFFADSFQRRVGTPLPIVAGDPHIAALVALGAPSRPSLFLDATPARSPWVSWDDVRSKGAIVVWSGTDAAGTPPPELKERFPDMVPEVRLFERGLPGRLPLLRIGWALIRPQSQAPTAAAAP
jgi:hypothetical protein